MSQIGRQVDLRRPVTCGDPQIVSLLEAAYAVRTAQGWGRLTMKKLTATILIAMSSAAFATASAPIPTPGRPTPSPFDMLSIFAPTGSHGEPTTGLDILQGAGPYDRGITVVMQEGSGEGIRVEKRNSGAFMAFYETDPATGQPRLHPSSRVGDGGNWETNKWVTISGTYMRWGTEPSNAGIVFLPASSRVVQGFPYQSRPSMLSVWADVETAAEFRTYNAPNGFTLALLDQDSGEELAGFDRWAHFRAGPGGRANHDVSFGRAGAGTWGVDGSLRLDSDDALPDPVAAGFGAVRAHRGPAGELLLVISDGAAWREVTLGAPIAP